MARTTSRKDSLASFIWTVGAADMVIGGVGERGSLFALGMLTVGAGWLVRWLRQQRAERATGAWRGQSFGPFPGGPFPGELSASAQAISGKARGVSAFIARQLNAAGVTSASPAARGYSAAARPGFRANRFVDSSDSRPRRDPRNAPSVQRARLIERPGDSPSQDRNPRRIRPSAETLQDRTASSRAIQGPPLNLPPAPRARSRRSRRIY